MEFDASIYNDDSVPDPTDFPPDTSAPGLRSLDGSFRCTICGEVYDAPVTLPCGHCFCSCCVRSAMAIKQECPSCRKAANEGHLRPNPAIEEVVAAWKASRAYVLRLVKEEERRRAISHQRGTPSKSVKKRKLTHERERSSSPDIECIPNPSRGPKTLTATNDILNSPCKPRKYKLSKLNTADSSTATSDTNEDELPAGSSVNPRHDSVNCPICEKRVVFRRMNQHIDSGCKDGLAPDPASANQSKQQWMKLMGAQQSKGKTKSMKDDSDDDEFPLPKATYGTLKDKKIKEMLLEHDLPVQGERNQWIARHQRWVMVYNANLDRSIPNRKTKGELRRELKRWEEDLKKKKNSVSDIVVYEKKQKPEFDRLIQMARQSKSKTSVPKDAFLPASLVRISSDGRERDSSPACSSSSSSVAEANVIVLDSEGERQNS